MTDCTRGLVSSELLLSCPCSEGKKTPFAKTNNGLEFGEFFWADIMRCSWLPSSSTGQVQLGYSRGSEKGWLETKTHFICRRGGKLPLKRALRDVRMPFADGNKAEKSAATRKFMNCHGLSEVFWIPLILLQALGANHCWCWHFSSSYLSAHGGSLALTDDLKINLIWLPAIFSFFSFFLPSLTWKLLPLLLISLLSS